MQSIRDDLPQFFIGPIGFTEENILKDTVSRDCCGLGFLCEMFSEVYSKILRIFHFTVPVIPYIGMFIPFFLVYFEYFQHINFHNVCI